MLVPASLIQCVLECLEIPHPVDGEVARLNVCLVEHENEWQAGFVEDTAVSANGHCDCGQTYEQA